LARAIHPGKVEEIPITKRKLEDANAVLEELKAGKIVGRAVLKPNGV
jgi:D-arabinose 1-dehydrogenase-like Zn-dependent alcohol dehydrogenase